MPKQGLPKREIKQGGFFPYPNLSPFGTQLLLDGRLLLPPKNEKKAIEIVKKVYAEYFGNAWSGLIETRPVTVIWVDGTIMWKDMKCSGLHFSADEMYVSVYDNTTFASSSLAHELAHCYQYLLLNYHDQDHTQQLWWKFLVPLAEQKLKEANL